MKSLAGHWAAEIRVAVSIVVLMLVLAWVAPSYFSRANMQDLFLANVPVLLIALGMTLVILTGEIDISVGSIFAIASVAVGMGTKLGLPVLLAVLFACVIGALLGGCNGVLVAYMGIPSIVVTLAALLGWRDALRWATQGVWVSGLPANFQWLGLTQAAYVWMMLTLALVLVGLFAFALRYSAAGRAVYATGTNMEAARLSGINPSTVKAMVFAALGALTGLAAALNAVRFHQIPSNGGLGMEMKVIAAVVVGGTAIRGGRGTIFGTILGVILLGSIGPALTFLGVSPYWEKAIQGGIILASVALEPARRFFARSATRAITPRHA